MDRKVFLQTSASILGANIIPKGFNENYSLRNSIRFAHVTDIHVTEGIVQESGMARALQHVQKQNVDFIINGGDAISDALAVDKENTQKQWNLFKTILKNENSLPVYHTIGNHDVWGWFIKDQKPDQDRLYGKVWVTEELNLINRYYSFKKDKWNFIVLDSTQLNPEGGYIAKIDELQLDWLETELSNIPITEYVCIVSHIPILSICAGLYFNKTQPNGDLLIQRNLMHTDFFKLKNIFSQYPQIKVCISGHIHLQDEVHYLGIKYFCNGAISGNWWKGSFQEFEPAYAVFDLFNDGTVSRNMVPYNV
ncbi:MAG TPA: metallophosphoesterase [Saprospiraceae bacterium]|nr:metallophosphoesterase [Saprospiraceae bacterium]